MDPASNLLKISIFSVFVKRFLFVFVGFLIVTSLGLEVCRRNESRTDRNIILLKDSNFISFEDSRKTGKYKIKNMKH